MTEEKEGIQTKPSLQALLSLFEQERDKLENNNQFERNFLVEEIEEEAQVKKILLRCYEDIYFVLEKYLDLNPDYIHLITLWVMGTYFHDLLPTYPYLFLNAMRGSGKTRLMKLIADLSDKGDLQNSLTEAVLFRTKGTLCIDEFERAIGKKGMENLIELLNCAYKQGVKVKRMKKVKVLGVEEQQVEEFNVYRPIAMANISGIDNVLGDRCLKVILEKSFNEKKVKLIEVLESKSKSVKSVLGALKLVQCSLCSVVFGGGVYREWNSYVKDRGTTLNYIYTYNTLNTLNTLKDKFKRIDESGIMGRDLEISFPLLILAILIQDDDLEMTFFDKTLTILKRIFEEKKEEEVTENIDISLIDYLSQEQDSVFFTPISKITEGFRGFLQINEDWLNAKWVGRALQRLQLVTLKRRQAKGIEVIINYSKARERIKQFKEEKK